MVSRDSKVHYSAGSLLLLTIRRLGNLAEIKRPESQIIIIVVIVIIFLK